ncbi:hypothetical protein FRB93_000485 [Tulasnella sp. JGI-2019a]|nr:hypothetical protein FRB93_000485 [Tulasnella sp. JGI-2019a]
MVGMMEESRANGLLAWCKQRLHGRRLSGVKLFREAAMTVRNVVQLASDSPP